jgi:hypothetical protein
MKIVFGPRTKPFLRWGLLHFWENDLKPGIECYERAETVAFGSSQRNLPKVVRQKMHLELAKVFFG